MWRTTTFLEIATLLAAYFCMPFNTLRSYQIGSECIYRGLCYRCSTAHSGAWNAANWSLIEDSTNRPLLKWFDLFNNQFERLEVNDTMPFLFPAIFFEFGGIEWISKSKGSKLQEGNAVFRVHVGLESYGESYDTSYDQTQQLENLDYMDYVFQALHLKAGTYFDKLKRSNDQTASDFNNIIVHTIDFQCIVYHEIEDDSDFEHTVTAMHINPKYDVVPYSRLVNEDFDNVVLNNTPTP